MGVISGALGPSEPSLWQPACSREKSCAAPIYGHRAAPRKPAAPPSYRNLRDTPTVFSHGGLVPR